MAANFNLKSVFTADTEGLKKGAADAKAVVKDFDESTTSALNEVTALFGTSMGDISRTLGTIKGGFLKLNVAIQGTSQAATLSAKAFNVLKIAMAASGIGLIVVALSSLVAYFTKSQRGADQLSKIMGQLKQVVLTVTDYFVKLGEAIVKAFKNPGEAVKKFWGILTNKEEREAFKNSLAAVGKDAEDRQRRRLALTERQIKLEEQLAKFEVEEGKLLQKIEEQKAIAADKVDNTAAQRAAANAAAQKLVAELSARRLKIAEEELAIKKEENALSESMRTDTMAEAQLQRKIDDILAAKSRMQKELLAQQSEINNQVKKEREEQERIANMQAIRAANAANLLPTVDGSKALKGLQVTTEIKPEFNPEPLKQGMEEAEGYMVDFQKIATDFSNTMTDAFSNMIEGLVDGELSMQDIFSTILQFLADTLKNIGKALIAYGTAMDAFKKALSNPWAAIAAGAALVAAGAVLSGLIKRASSGSSGGSSISAGYSAATVGGGGTLDLTGVTNMQGQQREIKVTGVLKASGNQLVAVINNENQRKNLTT